jgi:hypothetical protein
MITAKVKAQRIPVTPSGRLAAHGYELVAGIAGAGERG